MSGYLEYTVVYGVGCSARGCDEQVVLRDAEKYNFFQGREKVDSLAQEAGWSMWAGRSRRPYCPQHGPSADTNMFRLYGPDGGAS